MGSTDYSSTSTWYAQIIPDSKPTLLAPLHYTTITDDEVLEFTSQQTACCHRIKWQHGDAWEETTGVRERQRASRGTHSLMMTSFVSELVAKGFTLSDVIILVFVRMNSSKVAAGFTIQNL